MNVQPWNTQTELEQLNRIILDADVNVAIQQVRATLLATPAVAKTFERLLVYFSRENSALALESARYENLYTVILQASSEIIRRVDQFEADLRREFRECDEDRRQLRQLTAGMAGNATKSATTPEKSDDAK